MKFLITLIALIALNKSQILNPKHLGHWLISHYLGQPEKVPLGPSGPFTGLEIRSIRLILMRLKGASYG